MEITSTQPAGAGIIERRFRVEGAGGRSVPGVLWTREDAPPRTPLVLLGHGGSQSKDAPSMHAQRDWFTGAHGIATAAIDGPAHGERGPITSAYRPEYRALWQTPGLVDDMVTDWQRTLDALLALDEFEADAIGYLGLSQGTLFGLPFVAAEPRIHAAVLGLCGTRGPLMDTLGAGPRLAEDAPRVRCPVFYHVQWDDQWFDRGSAFELYELIGAADKRLQSTPGEHSGYDAEATEAMRAYLLRRLGSAQA